MAEQKDTRLGALRRFATAITVLNVLGHTVLGFEQSLATPVTAVLVAYATEILLEVVEARRLGRKPRFLGPGSTFIDFLLSAHITGLAVAMLLYANDRVRPVAFGAAVGFSTNLRSHLGTTGARRPFFNPSNL